MANPFFGQHRHEGKKKKKKREKLKAKRYSSLAPLHIQKNKINNTHLPANHDKSVKTKNGGKKVFDPTETPPHKIKEEKWKRIREGVKEKLTEGREPGNKGKCRRDKWLRQRKSHQTKMSQSRTRCCRATLSTSQSPHKETKENGKEREKEKAFHIDP